MTEIININMNLIPKSAGFIADRPGGSKTLYVQSVRELKKWVLCMVPETSDNHIIVSGYMSNCIALHLGLWLAGKGEIEYKNHSGLKRRMI